MSLDVVLGGEVPLAALDGAVANATSNPYPDPFEDPDARILFLLEVDVFPEPGT